MEKIIEDFNEIDEDMTDQLFMERDYFNCQSEWNCISYEIQLIYCDALVNDFQEFFFDKPLLRHIH